MRYEVEFDARDFVSKMKLIGNKAYNAGEEGMVDAVNEITRIASEISPIFKGTLQRSHDEKIKQKPGEIEATIAFSVREGKYNYAKWIHEGFYKLGERSRQKKGTVGWSGKHYDVGRKFLERPIKGEQEAIRRHLAKTIREAVEK